MQLRNKKDGEVYDVWFGSSSDLMVQADELGASGILYHSLKRMLQDWEDWDDNYKMEPVVPAVEDAEETETYSIQLVCLNCGKKEYFRIPLGTTVEDYARSHPCPNCGCCDLFKGWRSVFDEKLL